MHQNMVNDLAEAMKALDGKKARREKGICILSCNSGSRPCELGTKQTIFQDEPGGRLQSRLRGSLEAIESATKQKM